MEAARGGIVPLAIGRRENQKTHRRSESMCFIGDECEVVVPHISNDPASLDEAHRYAERTPVREFVDILDLEVDPLRLRHVSACDGEQAIGVDTRRELQDRLPILDRDQIRPTIDESLKRAGEHAERELALPGARDSIVELLKRLLLDGVVKAKHRLLGHRAKHSATNSGVAMRQAPKFPPCTRSDGQPQFKFTAL